MNIDWWIGTEKVDVKIQQWVAFSGKNQIELILPTGSEENVYKKHMREKGEGLHHLGFHVNNLEARKRVMARQGIDILQHGILRTKRGGVIHFAYYDLTHLCGAVLEFYEIRLFGFRLHQNNFFLNIAKLMGEVEKKKAP